MFPGHWGTEADPGTSPPPLKGTFCEVEIRSRKRLRHIIVPRTSIHDGHVYVVDPRGRLERREVEAAFTQSGFVAVRDGISPDETIVVSDPTPAIEGMLVNAIADDALRAELVADINSIAHQITRESAQKTCEKCHASDSPYFNAVSIILPMNDGTVERYHVDRAILESYFVSHFYLLGGTRVKLLDRIGFLIIAGGASAAFGHFIIRALTSPLRRREKEDAT